MRRASASALTFVLICACKADDQVLTPDEGGGGRDASVSLDSGMHPIVSVDGGAGQDANGAGATPGNDAALANDATTNGYDADPASDAATNGNEDGGPVMHTAKDPDCDLNGVWIARQNTESLALGLGQFANNYYLLEFAQDGEQVTVANHMDCGIVVKGFLELVTVEIAPETTRALIGHNRQRGRKGSFAKQANGTCAFQLEKFWSVRGVSEEMFAPKPRSREVSIEELKSENPLPTKAMASAAEDWDGDGQPGIAWHVMGVAMGTRHSAQRDWTQWFSATGYEVMAAANFGNDLVVRAEFSNEEVVYQASDESLTELSQANAAAAHTLTLRFLGRTRDDPRAQAILKADDFDTCRAIQTALPPLAGLK